MGSVLWLGRSLGVWHGNPLQYSCLENPMDRRAWQAKVHGVATAGHELVTKPPPPILPSWCIKLAITVGYLFLSLLSFKVRYILDILDIICLYSLIQLINVDIHWKWKWKSLSRVWSLRPHGRLPARLFCPWDSPGKNTGVGSRSLLQGIFPTQRSNPGLLHCRRGITKSWIRLSN